MKEIPALGVSNEILFSEFFPYQFVLGRCALAEGIQCVAPQQQIKNPGQ